MKKLIFLLLLIPSLLFAQDWQEARMSIGIVGGGAVAGASCTLWQTIAYDGHDYESVANSAIYSRTYVGQGLWDPGESKTICRVDFYVRGVEGSAVTWTAEIYAMSGTALGSAPTGTCVSTEKSITDTGWNSFVGLACQVATPTTYGITLTRPGHNGSATDYVTVYLSDDASASGNAMGWWGDDKTRQTDFAPHETTMRIYTQ